MMERSLKREKKNVFLILCMLRPLLMHSPTTAYESRVDLTASRACLHRNRAPSAPTPATSHESTSLTSRDYWHRNAMERPALMHTPTTAHESTSLTSRAWLHRNAAPSALAHANHCSRVDFTDPTRLALLQFCAQCSSYSNQCSQDDFSVFTNLMASFSSDSILCVTAYMSF